MAQALGGLLRPGGDTLEFLLLGSRKELVAGLQGVREARGAEVVGFADEHGRLELRVGTERFDRLEQAPAERQVLRLDLLLQGDGVRRDDHLPRLIHRVDDAGHEVGEALAHAGAGLEEQHLVVTQGRGHGPGHLLLLRTVFEMEHAVQPPLFRERFRRQRGRMADPDRVGADG